MAHREVTGEAPSTPRLAGARGVPLRPACRPRCQPGDPPRDGALPAAALAGLGQRPVRGLRARAVLHGAVRLLRLQHLHRRRARDAPGASRATYAEAALAEVRLARAGARARATCRCRRSSSAAARRPCSTPADLAAVLDGDRRRVRPRRRRRGHHRGQPGQRDARGRWPSCGRRASPGSPSACSRRCPHVLATLDRTHDPERVPAGGRLGAGGRLRPGQPRPDLRHAGGVARGLGDLAGGRAGLRARPRVGVRPDRRGGHRAGPAGPPRRAPRPGRRRPGRQVPARRRAARGGRAGVVRAVQLGARPTPPGAGTTSSTGPAPTGGASGPARTPTSAAPAGGTSGTRRRTPTGSPPATSPAQAREVLDARDAARRAGAARDRGCAAGWPSRCSTTPAAPAVPDLVGARPAHRRRRPARAHPGRAGCSPTPSSATCCPDPAVGRWLRRPAGCVSG